MSFNGHLSIKCMSLSKEQFISSPTLIDLKPIELNSYPFMINLDVGRGSFHILDDSATNICVPNKPKDKG